MRALISGLVFIIAVLVGQTATAAEPFNVWLKGLRADAAAQGVSDAVLDKALKGVAPIKRVIKADRNQAEFTQTFWGYLDRRISAKRIKRAQMLMKKHQGLLAPIVKKYGVPARFLVSFWALETNFGDYTGKIPLYSALATLAYDGRRADFFRAQLITALKLMQRGDLTADAQGSWAGAMGNCQFIPSTYWAYAVDHDGDGRRDLWNNLGDVFASAGNYLSQVGWQAQETWGREISLPETFDLELAGLSIRKPIGEWQALGVRRIEGWDLPKATIEGSVILPAGRQGPAFLVYTNFRTILKWNRSISYAASVGHLADRIAGKGPFVTPRPKNDRPMPKENMMEIQRVLGGLGFDAGTPDGIAGAQTRAAIKGFQRKAQLPPDGHPSFGLLERLRSVAGKGTAAR